MNELSKESLGALFTYWTNERKYARDCRSTQQKRLRTAPITEIQYWTNRYNFFNNRYNQCDSEVRYFRKLLKQRM